MTVTWVFFHEHSLFTEQQGKGEAISLIPLYHFYPLHRHLDISRAITAESSSLQISTNRTRTGSLWFKSESREPLSYAPSNENWEEFNLYWKFMWTYENNDNNKKNLPHLPINKIILIETTLKLVISRKIRTKVCNLTKTSKS